MPNDSDDSDDPDTLEDLFSNDDIDGLLDGLEKDQSTSTSIGQEQNEFLSVFKSMAGGIFLIAIFSILATLAVVGVLLYFAFAILQHYGILVALPLLL